jgi:hypothetical protein
MYIIRVYLQSLFTWEEKSVHGMLENYNNANIYAGRYRVPPWMKGKLVKSKNKLIPPNLTVCGYNLPQKG